MDRKRILYGLDVIPDAMKCDWSRAVTAALRGLLTETAPPAPVSEPAPAGESPARAGGGHRRCDCGGTMRKWDPMLVYPDRTEDTAVRWRCLRCNAEKPLAAECEADAGEGETCPHDNDGDGDCGRPSCSRCNPGLRGEAEAIDRIIQRIRHEVVVQRAEALAHTPKYLPLRSGDGGAMMSEHVAGEWLHIDAVRDLLGIVDDPFARRPRPERTAPPAQAEKPATGDAGEGGKRICLVCGKPLSYNPPCCGAEPVPPATTGAGPHPMALQGAFDPVTKTAVLPAESGDLRGEAEAAEWAERMVEDAYLARIGSHDGSESSGIGVKSTDGLSMWQRDVRRYIRDALVAFARRPRPERTAPPTPAATDAVRTAAARLLEALAARNITDEWPVISGPMKALRAALASAPGQGEARPRAEWYVSNGTVTVSLPSGTAFDYHCLTREHAEHLQAAVNWPAGSGVVVLQQTAEAVRRWASSPVTDKAALGALFDALTSDPALARPSEPAHGGEVGR
jgi:hypothetical protein